MSLCTQRFYEVHRSAGVIWHHHHGLNYCFKNSYKVLLRKSFLDECTIPCEKYIVRLSSKLVSFRNRVKTFRNKAVISTFAFVT